jgi:hypothetical protein
MASGKYTGATAWRVQRRNGMMSTGATVLRVHRSNHMAGAEDGATAW